MKYILAVICSLFVMSTPALALAASAAPICGQSASSAKGQVLYGAEQSGSDCGGGVTKVVKAVISILSVVVGIVAVIMIIISGFKYVTSGGDSNKISSAKSTLIYALVGLVIAALAQFLVVFVLTNTSTATSCPPGKSLNSSGVCV